MLQTIEVEIDTNGLIKPLEQLPFPENGKARALLTLLPFQTSVQKQSTNHLPAAGVLSSKSSVSLWEMDAIVRQRGCKI